MAFSWLPCAQLKLLTVRREWILGGQLPLSVITFQGFFLASPVPPNTLSHPHPTSSEGLLQGSREGSCHGAQLYTCRLSANLASSASRQQEETQGHRSQDHGKTTNR